MKAASHGLPKKTVAHLHKVFADHPQVDKAILYGSRAMGNYRKDSDIDLSLHGERLTQRAIMKIAGEIDDLPIPYTVDLSAFDLLSHAKLRDHIERVGKIFYQKEKTEWKTVRLGDVCSIIIGKTPPRKDKDFWDKEKKGNNIWVSIADLSRAINRKISESKEYISDSGASLSAPVEKGTLLLSFKLSIGKMAFADKKLWTNEAIAALSIKGKDFLDNEFLYHALSSINWNSLAGDDIKIKGKTLNKKKLCEIVILIPSVEEQRRIVARLDSAFAEIDKAISACKRKQSEIEQLKQSVLKSEIEGNKNLSPIGKLFEITSSKRVIKSQWQRKGIPFYRGREITQLSKTGHVKNSLFITNDLYEKFAGKYGVPKEGDILITGIGTIGSSYVVKTTDKFYFKDGSVLWLKKTTPNDSEYVRYWIKSPCFTSRLNKNNGTTVDTLTIKTLREIKIPLPSLAEQKRIVKKLDAIFEQADIALDTVKKQLALYESLKSAILTSELGNKT